jgi:predicted ATPase
VRRDLPTGTVTFLFTDVEGSTRLLHELGAEAYAEALAEHRRVIREACAVGGGAEVDTQGDAFFFAFPTAGDAMAAASSFTEALVDGPIQVRVGVHTGTPLLTEEGYVGDDVHFAARVAAAAHGGQVVCSDATAQLVDVELVDLGFHRLKDVAAPVAIYQLGDVSFPPLGTIANTNLPRPASSFVGRESERDAVLARIEAGARLLTLTGPGGSGKTRLAIEVATSLVPQYSAGVYWVGLATVRDPGLVSATIAQTLGAKTGLADHIAGRELLLLLDNFEQVVDAAPALGALVESCPRLTLLITSRELLRVRGEAEYQVPPLGDPEAVALFAARSGLDGSLTVAELCVRLDNLPLAVELAAARTRSMTLEQILDRIGQRLDFLQGGRDADPRQQTLRATIEWSYELLTSEEQRLFARLSVFVGGCTLEAAEDVCDADVDTLQSLVEKSLVRFTNERYWMLETIREYASDQLELDGVALELALRHALFFRSFAAAQYEVLEAGEPEEGPVALLAADIDNLRAAVSYALGAGETDVVREITLSLFMFWVMRGQYSEGRTWLERAISLDETSDETRRRLFSSLARLAYTQGDHVAATEASDQAAALAAELGGASERLALLREAAFAALVRGELWEAERLFSERLEEAIAVDNGVATSACRLNLVSIANKTGRHERAEQLLGENLVFVRSKGQARCEAHTLAGLAETAVEVGRPGDCAADSLLAATRALQIDDEPLAAYALDLSAASAAANGDARDAARLLGATAGAREAMGAEADEDENALRERVLAMLEGRSGVEQALDEGRDLGLVEALELARTASRY